MSGTKNPATDFPPGSGRFGDIFPVPLSAILRNIFISWERIDEIKIISHNA